MSTRTLRGAQHHLCVDFLADGSGKFYPTTARPADLARRLATFLDEWLTHETSFGDTIQPGTGSIEVDLPRGAEHHVCLDFFADGPVVVHLATRRSDLHEAAGRLGALVPQLLEQPTAIQCAAGYHPQRGA